MELPKTGVSFLTGKRVSEAFYGINYSDYAEPDHAVCKIAPLKFLMHHTEWNICCERSYTVCCTCGKAGRARGRRGRSGCFRWTIHIHIHVGWGKSWGGAMGSGQAEPTQPAQQKVSSFEWPGQLLHWFTQFCRRGGPTGPGEPVRAKLTWNEIRRVMRI